MFLKLSGFALLGFGVYQYFKPEPEKTTYSGGYGSSIPKYRYHIDPTRKIDLKSKLKKVSISEIHGCACFLEPGKLQIDCSKKLSIREQGDQLFITPVEGSSQPMTIQFASPVEELIVHGSKNCYTEVKGSVELAKLEVHGGIKVPRYPCEVIIGLEGKVDRVDARMKCTVGIRNGNNDCHVNASLGALVGIFGAKDVYLTAGAGAEIYAEKCKLHEVKVDDTVRIENEYSA